MDTVASVQIRATTSKNTDVDQVCLTVDYFKSSAQVRVTAYPCSPSIGGMTTVLVTNGYSCKLFDMTRKNQKQIDTAKANVRAQVAAKNGPAWDIILKVLADGYELAEPEKVNS